LDKIKLGQLFRRRFPNILLSKSAYSADFRQKIDKIHC